MEIKLIASFNSNWEIDSIRSEGTLKQLYHLLILLFWTLWGKEINNPTTSNIVYDWIIRWFLKWFNDLWDPSIQDIMSILSIDLEAFYWEPE